MLRIAPSKGRVDVETLPTTFIVDLDWPKEGGKKGVKVEWELVEVRLC